MLQAWILGVPIVCCTHTNIHHDHLLYSPQTSCMIIVNCKNVKTSGLHKIKDPWATEVKFEKCNINHHIYVCTNFCLLLIIRNMNALLKDLWATWNKVWYNFKSQKRYKAEKVHILLCFSFGLKHSLYLVNPYTSYIWCWHCFGWSFYVE